MGDENHHFLKRASWTFCLSLNCERWIRFSIQIELNTRGVKQDIWKPPNVPTWNVSLPDDPRSAAHRAQGSVGPSILKYSFCCQTLDFFNLSLAVRCKCQVMVAISRVACKPLGSDVTVQGNDSSYNEWTQIQIPFSSSFSSSKTSHPTRLQAFRVRCYRSGQWLLF